MYHSLKDSSGTSGISRPSYYLFILLLTNPGIFFITNLPDFPAILKIVGFAKTVAMVFIAMVLDVGACPSLGITVISTDFKAMGKTAAKLILENNKEKFKNPFHYIERNSL